MEEIKLVCIQTGFGVEKVEVAVGRANNDPEGWRGRIRVTCNKMAARVAR